MKSTFYIFFCLLFFSQCKQKDEYVQAQLNQHPGSPGILVNQHQDLLAKARLLSAEKDSIGVKLYDLLKYHFTEEEQYVFPVLAKLPELAAGNIPANSDSIVALTMKFKSNSAKLLAEHQMIKSLIEEYKVGAKTQSQTGFEEFQKALAEHASAEEEIFFPATVLIGDYLKFKSNSIKK